MDGLTVRRINGTVVLSVTCEKTDQPTPGCFADFRSWLFCDEVAGKASSRLLTQITFVPAMVQGRTKQHLHY